jgi:hypothetical protein
MMKLCNAWLMTVVEIFMAALLSGVITDEELDRLDEQRPCCSRVEAVMLESLDRLIAQAVLRRGCRLTVQGSALVSP